MIGSLAAPKPPSWWTADPGPEDQKPPPVTGHDPAATIVAPPAVDEPDERAVLIAEGAEVPLAWAEGYDAICMMPPPVDFWPERWRRTVDATGVSLDRWAGEAIRCGWSDLDVFGCHPDRPTVRRDCMGLILLLDRCQVVSVDPDGADLVTVTGARQRFYRRPLPPGTVALWELWCLSMPAP